MSKPVNKLKRDVKGISPLIATLLLIAIAVAASVITYSWVMSMIGSQSTQAQTAVRIDNVVWDAAGDNVTVTVRNIGSVNADVVTVGVKLSTSSSYTAVTTSKSIAVSAAATWELDFSGEIDIVAGSNYNVQVITSTGFENVKTNLAAS